MRTFTLTFFSACLVVAVKSIPLESRDTKLPWDIKVPPTYSYCRADIPNRHTYEPLMGADLVHVQLVIRHGDRTPLNPIIADNTVWDSCSRQLDTMTLADKGSLLLPLEDIGMAVQQRTFIPPENKKSFASVMYQGNCDQGQLTDGGKAMHVELGEMLREIYVEQLDYLNPEFDQDDFYLRSTNLWRTKNSAEALLKGLYPAPFWQDGRVLPMLTWPSLIENMSPNEEVCPRIDDLTQDALKEPEWKIYEKRYKPLTDRVSRVLNDTMLNAGYVDVLMTRVCHDKPLPCSINPITQKREGSDCIQRNEANEIMNIGSLQYVWVNRDSPQATEIDKLSIGSFLYDLATEIRAAMVEHTLDHKFSIYSAHDSSLGAILGSFNASDSQMLWPPYRSNMLIELWKQKYSNSYKIRVLYNGQTLIVNTNDEWCDLNECDASTFLKRLDSFVPDNLLEACNSS
ncbi:phosphoglycerate mutase-like protein [Hesseltinella vesiculosa]|uniref:Phosphoglycerate mutase-like protein n=1 Tax=Hesseltinella vesiculosa TaxID=101127 RepID=A0A1X2GB62_9FUNG|nr:phosphoglycerate mutase-like protein [Hesseltinella vesiculosa]